MPAAAPEPLEIRAPHPENDREAVLDLVAKTFRHPYFVMHAYCRDEYFDPASYDWKASRIGVMDGRVVTHWGVWRQEMRIGRATVLVAGVGAVSTHADYRNRGLLAMTAKDAIAGFAAAGYDVTLLFGIPGFYHRFGYVIAYTDAGVEIAAADLPAEMPVRLERVGIDRRAELDKLYNRHFAEISGTVRRPFLPRRPPGGHDAIARAGTSDGWYAWQAAPKAGKTGKAALAGYVAVEFDDGKLAVLEGVGDPETVLAAAGALAREKRCREVTFKTLSPRTPVAAALRGRAGREVRFRQVNRGPMGRTVNLRATVTKLLPELTRRVETARPDLPAGTLLTLTDPRERVTLAWQGGQVVLAEAGPASGKGAPKAAACHVAGGEAVYRFLMGSAAPEEILDLAGLRADAETRRRLDLLFPEQFPLIPRMDFF